MPGTFFVFLGVFFAVCFCLDLEFDLCGDIDMVTTAVAMLQGGMRNASGETKGQCTNVHLYSAV